MSRVFDLLPHYYDTGWKLYSKKQIKINPGVTVLVGCNGSGKTTLIRQMKETLDREDIPHISFNNLLDGGNTSRQAALIKGDLSFLANSVMSSEGENIFHNIANIVPKIVGYMKSRKPDEEAWIFLDAIDSGMSIDNIVQLKEQLFETMFEIHSDRELYIIVSANAYEMASGEQCFDVWAGKYITFPDYDAYRKFIIKSRERKSKRYQ